MKTKNKKTQTLSKTPLMKHLMAISLKVIMMMQRMDHSLEMSWITNPTIEAMTKMIRAVVLVIKEVAVIDQDLLETWSDLILEALEVTEDQEAVTTTKDVEEMSVMQILRLSPRYMFQESIAELTKVISKTYSANMERSDRLPWNLILHSLITKTMPLLLMQSRSSIKHNSKVNR